MEMKHRLFRCAALRTDEVHPLRGDCHLHGPADTDDGSHELGGERFIQFPDVGYVTTRDQERVTNGRPAPVRGVQVHGMVYGMVTDCRERRIGPTDYPARPRLAAAEPGCFLRLRLGYNGHPR